MADASPPLRLAVIPDGQRRWARANGKSFKEAYEAGAAIIQAQIDVAAEEGAAVFAVWGGSVENLRERPAAELAVLHAVYETFLKRVRDEWMHEPANAALRFVHMGRADLLTKTERALIDEIAAATKDRPGMVVALCLGYSGRDEEERALEEWKAGGCAGDWKQHLDLPKQGIPYATFDLIVRTGEGTDGPVHDNEFLHAYRGETRVRFRPELFPDVSAEMLRDDISAFRAADQRRGA
jgi:undecaprenyl diphosphate synthase